MRDLTEYSKLDNSTILLYKLLLLLQFKILGSLLNEILFFQFG